MRALLHNPGKLALFTGAAPEEVEFTAVPREALHSAAERLGRDDQLPLMLVGETGQSLLRDLRQAGFGGPVLVLLPQASARQAADLLYAGADDVLVLPVDGHELAARLAAVSRRLRGVSAGSVSLGALEFYLDGRHPVFGGQEVKLSAREYDILRQLMLNINRVVTKEAIYNALYALTTLPPFDKIIDVYICRLRAKLSKAVPGGGAYIETVQGRGYRMILPDSLAHEAAPVAALAV